MAPSPRAQPPQDDVESLLNDLARSFSGWFWEMDADLRFTYMSPTVEAITGVAPEWHYGKSRADIGIPSSVSPQAWQQHLDCMACRAPFREFEFQREGPDGLKWVQTSGVPVFDEEGRFAGYRGIATDITARVEAETRAERLMAAVENLNDIFVLWDADDTLVLCNAKFRELNAAVADKTEPGTRFEDYIRAALEVGLFPEAAGREEAWYAQRVAFHRRPGPAMPLERQDGRWVLLAEHPLPDGSTATIAADITESKRAERALAAKHEILVTALKTIPDGVEVLDENLRLVAWNDQLFKVMDLDADAILGAKDPGEAFCYSLARRGDYGPGDVDELVASRRAIARSRVPVEYERQLVTGKWIECRGNPIAGGGYVAVYRDIDESKRLRERLEVLATTDPLTGILNRGRFMELASLEFERARRYKRPVSMVVLDVDHFKAINDRFGHAAGDEALRRVASACRDALREVDSVGRIGGEEFAAVLPETDCAAAAVVAERLRRTVAQLAVSAGGESVRMTASIGVAEAADGHRSAEDVIAAADAALYEAKRGGRNKIVSRCAA